MTHESITTGFAWIAAAICFVHTAAAFAAAPPADEFACESRDGAIAISHSGKPVATYVFHDTKILRPYFAGLHAPGGIQVTRNQPPKAGADATDHDTMHPGLWLAFGDINGQDFWRNKAAITHVRFVEPPAARDGRLIFITESRLQTADNKTLGSQLSHITLETRPQGCLLIWDSTFTATEQDLFFGDQEEMGLGVRVATPITEKNGGAILSSTGMKTAKTTWGKAFDWCDYSGVIDGRRVGVTLMPDSANFRPSWFHNRDYGLMVANPFGRKAMTGGEQSRVEVKKGERLRLRFGILLHSAASDKDVNLAAAYRDFVGQSPKQAP
ncbi:MAG: PmoA family protein [Planctomycetota bacterium]|nr:PmoA family protein [Planctomycetota bacterium]